MFLPVRDGDLIAAQPVDAVRRGAAATVDLLVGTNSKEMNLYFVPTGFLQLIANDEAVCASIRGRHPEPEKLVAAYRASRPDATSGELFSAIMTDWMFYLPSVRLAEAHAPHAGGTYLYEFAWPSPTFGGKLDACHGLELGFVFDTLDTPGLTGPDGLVGRIRQLNSPGASTTRGSPLPRLAIPAGLPTTRSNVRSCASTPPGRSSPIPARTNDRHGMAHAEHNVFSFGSLIPTGKEADGWKVH